MVTQIGILPMFRWRRGARIHVLYSDGSLKWLAVCMVSAEMLNCKLLSTQAAGIKHLYFTWCDGNHQWPAMAELYIQSRKLKSRYMARNRFQEPSLELSSQAIKAGGPVRQPFAYLVPSPHVLERGWMSLLGSWISAHKYKKWLKLSWELQMHY